MSVKEYSLLVALIAVLAFAIGSMAFVAFHKSRDQVEIERLKLAIAQYQQEQMK